MSNDSNDDASAQSRNTFQSYALVLNDIATRLRSAADCLRVSVSRKGVNERYELILSSIADVEEKLALDLERYAIEGPREVVETRVQYLIEMSEISNETASASAGDALQQLVDVNDDVSDLFRRYADKAQVPDVVDAMQALRVQVLGASKRIAQIRQSAHEF